MALSSLRRFELISPHMRYPSASTTWMIGCDTAFVDRRACNQSFRHGGFRGSWVHCHGSFSMSLGFFTAKRKMLNLCSSFCRYAEKKERLAKFEFAPIFIYFFHFLFFRLQTLRGAEKKCRKDGLLPFKANLFLFSSYVSKLHWLRSPQPCVGNACVRVGAWIVMKDFSQLRALAMGCAYVEDPSRLHG